MVRAKSTSISGVSLFLSRGTASKLKERLVFLSKDTHSEHHGELVFQHETPQALGEQVGRGASFRLDGPERR